MHLPHALAFDLDGTLAQSKQPMTAQMGDLISKLLCHVPVALFSGASFRQFEREFLAAVPPGAPLGRLYLFPDNAAQCYCYADGKWVAQYDHRFSAQEADDIMAALSEAAAEVGLVEAQTWGPQIENRGAQVTFSGLGQDAPLEAKAAWDPTGQKRAALRQAAAKRLPDYSVATGGMTSVDVTRRGITKAYGIEQFAKLTHIPIIEMLYVGDALGPGGNDAVVAEAGVPVHATRGPEETAAFIESLLAQERAGV